MRERLAEQGLTPEEMVKNFPILASRPDLYPDLEWIWEGYTVLASSRQMGMSGPQPISLTEMLSFLDFACIEDREERAEFVHLCQHVDRIFMADYLAKNKSPAPPKGKPPR